MPLNPLPRRDSWPPTQVRLADDADNVTDDDLDLNPFSYFLTAPEDGSDEDMEDIDLSAGIEEPGSSTSGGEPVIRSISPSSLQRRNSNDYAIYDDDEEDDEDYIRDIKTSFAVPMTLKEYVSSHDLKKMMLPGRKREGHDAERRNDGAAVRGRGILKVPYGGRARGRTRSLSSGRPHAWREPSPDVWSIPEEREEEAGAEREATPGLSDDGLERGRAPMSPLAKGKKHVHWAD